MGIKTQDVVKVGLAVGWGLPDDAKGIAITYNAITPTTTKTDIADWIAVASERGSKKWEAIPETRPRWLKLCALTLTDDSGEEYVRVWYGSSDKYYIGREETDEVLRTAKSLAVIAMCWALAHPEQALVALRDYPGRDDDPLADAMDPAGVWLEMARNSLSLFSTEFALPAYDDEQSWNLGHGRLSGEN